MLYLLYLEVLKKELSDKFLACFNIFHLDNLVFVKISRINYGMCPILLNISMFSINSQAICHMLDLKNVRVLVRLFRNKTSKNISNHLFT